MNFARRSELDTQQQVSRFMKALFTADWHITNSLPHAKRDPKSLVSDRLKDLKKVIDWIISQARSHKVPLFILGDLFDRRQPDAPALKAAASILSSAGRAGVQIYILPGNHDAHDSRGLHYVVELFAAAKLSNIHVLKAKPVTVGGIHYCPVPSMSNKATLEAIQKHRSLKESPKVLLLHSTITGSRLSGGHIAEDGISKDELEGFDAVIAGHVHEFQSLSPVNGIYVGSPMQLNFNEVGHSPAIGALTLKGKVKLHRVAIPEEISRGFHEIRIDGEGKTRISGNTNGLYRRIIFTGTQDELKIYEHLIEDAKKFDSKRLRSCSFYHRDKGASGHVRLDVDIIADGVPSLETLVSEYAKQKRPKAHKELVDEGISILGGLS